MAFRSSFISLIPSLSSACWCFKPVVIYLFLPHLCQPQISSAPFATGFSLWRRQWGKGSPTPFPTCPNPPSHQGCSTGSLLFFTPRRWSCHYLLQPGPGCPTVTAPPSSQVVFSPAPFPGAWMNQASLSPTKDCSSFHPLRIRPAGSNQLSLSFTPFCQKFAKKAAKALSPIPLSLQFPVQNRYREEENEPKSLFSSCSPSLPIPPSETHGIRTSAAERIWLFLWKFAPSSEVDQWQSLELAPFWVPELTFGEAAWFPSFPPPEKRLLHRCVM